MPHLSKQETHPLSLTREPLLLGLVGSVIVHGLIIFTLFLNRFSVTSYKPAAAAIRSPIEAVAVDARSLEREIAAVKQAQAAEKAKEVEKKQKLAREVRQAKTAKVREQARIAKLKQEQLNLQRKLEKAKSDSQKQLDSLKKQQQNQQRKLAKQKKALSTKKSAPTTTAKTTTQNGLGAGDQQKVDKYKELILHAIGQRWIVPENVSTGISCELLIHLAPGGTVLNVTMLHGSGNPTLDSSAIKAVHQSSPLPVPSETTLFNQFRLLHLTVRPEKMGHS